MPPHVAAAFLFAATFSRRKELVEFRGAKGIYIDAIDRRAVNDLSDNGRMTSFGSAPAVFQADDVGHRAPINRKVLIAIVTRIWDIDNQPKRVPGHCTIRAGPRVGWTWFMYTNQYPASRRERPIRRLAGPHRPFPSLPPAAVRTHRGGISSAFA